MVLQHLITALSNLFIIVADGIQNVKVNLRTQIIVSMAVAIDSIEVNYFYDACVCLQFLLPSPNFAGKLFRITTARWCIKIEKCITTRLLDGVALPWQTNEKPVKMLHSSNQRRWNIR